MSTPDLSKSPQHVALAKALGAVYSPRDKWEDFTTHMKGQLLMFADAAITHLGSGYVLPPATEENAERLARKKHENDYPKLTWFFDTSEQQRSARIGDSLRYLRALLDAFGDAEKPEPAGPVPICSKCGKEMRAVDAGKDICWRCRMHATDYSDPNSPADPTFCRDGCEKPFGHHGQHSDEDVVAYGNEEKAGPDFAAEAAERERARLAEAFMLALVANPAVMVKFFDPLPTPAGVIAEAIAGMAQNLAQELIG